MPINHDKTTVTWTFLLCYFTSHNHYNQNCSKNLNFWNRPAKVPSIQNNRMVLWAVVPQLLCEHEIKPTADSLRRLLLLLSQSSRFDSDVPQLIIPPPLPLSRCLPSRAVRPSPCCHGRRGCRPGWCDGPPCRVQRDGGAGKRKTLRENTKRHQILLNSVASGLPGRMKLAVAASWGGITGCAPLQRRNLEDLHRAGLAQVSVEAFKCWGTGADFPLTQTSENRAEANWECSSWLGVGYYRRAAYK